MKRTHAGIGTTFLVMALLVIGMILATATHQSATSTARQGHIHLLGREATLVAQNLIDEGFYSMFVRINSPRSSQRYSPDVYALIRNMGGGTSEEIEIAPQLATRTLAEGRVTAKPIRAKLIMGTLKLATSTRVPVSIGAALAPPAPASSPGAAPPAALPAGTSGRVCYTLPRPPEMTIELEMARGQLELTSSVEAQGGDGLKVGREMTVTYPFTVSKTKGTPPVAFVNLQPIQDSQQMKRWEKRDAK